MDSLPAETPGKPKNTRVGSLSLRQQIFLTQELNQGLLHCRQILYPMSYQGSTCQCRRHRSFCVRKEESGGESSNGVSSVFSELRPSRSPEDREDSVCDTAAEAGEHAGERSATLWEQRGGVCPGSQDQVALKSPITVSFYTSKSTWSTSLHFPTPYFHSQVLYSEKLTE